LSVQLGILDPIKEIKTMVSKKIATNSYFFDQNKINIMSGLEIHFFLKSLASGATKL
jgi:hypothetical protein